MTRFERRAISIGPFQFLLSVSLFPLSLLIPRVSAGVEAACFLFLVWRDEMRESFCLTITLWD